MKLKGQLLTHTSYPLYEIAIINNRHLVLAGGGGEAKTGVPNRIEIFSLSVDSNVTSLVPYLVATKVCTVDTDRKATMNIDVSWPGVLPNKEQFILATGQDSLCKLYDLSPSICYLLDGQLVAPSADENISKVGSRRKSMDGQARRRKSESRVHEPTPERNLDQNGMPPNVVSTKAVTYAVTERKSLQTDFDSNGAFQKVVRIAPGANYMVTGGCDGHFRVWELPSCRKLLDHNAHKGDIDDIAISMDGVRFLTLGRDAKAFIWSVQDGTKFAELKNPFTPEKYRYRAAKFTAKGKEGPLFFTASIPIQRGTKMAASVVTQWVMLKSEILAIHHTKIPKEVISAMAVDNAFQFLAFGTLGGSIFILDSLELTVLKYIPETHGIFVTGVAFLPIYSKEITQLSCIAHKVLCGVASVSADDTVQVHFVPRLRRRTFCGNIFLISAIVTCLMLFLSFLDL